MKISSYWWVDGGFSLEKKLTLRKKLAEFPQVTLADSKDEFVIASIPINDLTAIIVASLHEVIPEENKWLWISFMGDRSRVNQAELGKMIAGHCDYAVYSFLQETYSEPSPELYRELKKQIMANEIPVFCLNGTSNLHDQNPKVILDFLKVTFSKKILLKTTNPRYGHIVKKELISDQKLKDRIEVTVEDEMNMILMKLSTDTPVALERAVNIVIKNARAFKLECKVY